MAHRTITRGISIHAPARGATLSSECLWIFQIISIHAPARGATTSMLDNCAFKDYFNPRSREGSDDVTTFRDCLMICISIHAPARGATRSRLVLHCEGTMISIHAPARGATITQENHYQSIRYFNPRSREGSDKETGREQPGVPISIHAPARGATKKFYGDSSKYQFQSTLPRGERRHTGK